MQKEHSQNGEELLLSFDEERNSQQPILRSVAHGGNSLFWHAVSCIWIVNSKMQILVSKRALHLQRKPGKWQANFGGHVKADQNFETCAVEELREEIGLHIDVNELHAINEKKDEGPKHFSKRFVLHFDGDITNLKFVDGEITAIRWMNFDEYEIEYDMYSDTWCNRISKEDWEQVKSVFHLSA